MPGPALDAERPPARLDATMVACIKTTAVFAVAFAVGGSAIDGLRTGGGVLVGGVLATANLWAFALIVRGVLTGGDRGKRWGVAGGLKFFALLAIAWIVMSTGLSSGLALAIGYGALPLGITIGGLFGSNTDPQ